MKVLAVKQFLLAVMLLAGGYVVYPLLSVYGDTACTAKISYSWRPEEGAKDIEETFLEIQSVAEDEEKAKEALNSIYLRREKHALENCQKKHQNLSGCISSRLHSSSQAFSLLSFPARREVEKSIIKDCKKQNGKCLGVKLGKIHCSVPQNLPKEDKGEEKKSKK